MKGRCLNPKSTGYKYYGGRGISVWPEWVDSFEAFFTHIGEKPTPEHSLDRIDVNGNYEPGNVRWATTFEQAVNKTRIGAPVKLYICNTCLEMLSTDAVRSHGPKCKGKP